MDNNLQFILSLQDQFSGVMKAASGVSDTEAAKISDDLNKIGGNATNGFNQASSSAEKFKNEVKHTENTLTEFGEQVQRIFERIGIYLGAYEIINWVKESMSETKKLNEVQAQLANTLKNSGQFTADGFKEIIKGSKEMSEHMLYTKADVIGLQSQLRLVGNISEGTMQKMVVASADMAAKFGMNLNEAGNMLAKAVNNPEMMRRLGMQLKIDPAMQEYIQNLAKHGKEAQAQLLLLEQVENKVGGAAAAAFNADPLARFHKTMEEIQLRVGTVALWLTTKLAAAFNDVVEAVKDVIAWMEQHKTLMEIVGVVVGVVTTAIILQYTWIGIVAGATKAWAAVQWLLNESMLANPLTWIIALIIAVVAAIGYVIYATKGWGEQWKDVVGFAKATWAAFKDNFVLIWLNVQDTFMGGLELIEKGWYHLKSLWDADGAAVGLAKINDEQNKRAEAIAQQKGVLASDLKAAESHLKWDITSNGKTLTDLTNDLKKKLGFGGISSPVSMNGAQGNKNGDIPGLIPTGKDKSDSINSGGQRSIVINIAKQTGAENIYVSSGQEGANEIESLVREAMRRVMLSINGNAVAN